MEQSVLFNSSDRQTLSNTLETEAPAMLTHISIRKADPPPSAWDKNCWISFQIHFSRCKNNHTKYIYPDIFTLTLNIFFSYKYLFLDTKLSFWEDIFQVWIRQIYFKSSSCFQFTNIILYREGANFVVFFLFLDHFSQDYSITCSNFYQHHWKAFII